MKRARLAFLGVVMALGWLWAASAEESPIGFSGLTTQERLEYANALESKGKALRRALAAKRADLRRAEENAFDAAMIAAIDLAHEAVISEIAARVVSPAAVRSRLSGA